ncbi:hypothetical protein [Chryseobacterium lactis]|uniref:hypothetical protein n=1 Tax=Chryseobacterium lactis TaxID=1241981 RepID=UPI001628CB03|nr:hypothetical protein [Chryseobacterium lactis]
MKNSHLKQCINLFFLLLSSILLAQITGTHYVGRPANYVSADKTPNVGSLAVICDGEGKTGNVSSGQGAYDCYWLKDLNPITIKLNMASPSKISAMSFYGPWGFDEWVKDVEIKFYNNSNALLGTETLTLPQISGTAYSNVPLSAVYMNVARVEFKILNGYGISPFNRVSLSEIVFKDQIVDVPVIQQTAASCSAAGTATITNYNSVITYQFSPSGPSVGAGGVISGMAAGTNYTVKAVYNGDVSAASTSFSIEEKLPTPVTPTVSTTPATCSASGTATISNYNSAYTYTFSPSGPSISTGGIISGMTVGTNYTVTAKSASCTSAASASFSIAGMLPTPVTPTVSTTPAICSASGTATISNYNSAYTYTFSPSGPSVGAGGIISGMTVGTNYIVTAKNSSCTSASSTSFSIAAMLPTPVTPTVSTTPASCSAAGTATISNYNSAYAYTFSPSGPSVGAGGIISGMTAGTNYTVTAKSAGCTSTASASFSIAAMLPTPAVPVVSVIAGTATISNYNSAYTYVFSPAGPSVGAGGLISGMIAGTSYTVTAKNGSCTSAASTSFSFLCTKPGDFSSAGVPTKFGITVQQKQAGWPESIPNGFIILESKTKGLVITRVQNQAVIADPKEGMLIYDIDAACVKLYNGTLWNCIQRSCNN